MAADLCGFMLQGLFLGLAIGLVYELTKTAWLTVDAGRLGGRQFRLEKARAIIGRAEECDIGLFGDPSVLGRHAQIERENSHFVISDLAARSGLRVNSRLVAQASLNDGDQISIGNYLLTFHSRAKVAGAGLPTRHASGKEVGVVSPPTVQNAWLISSQGRRIAIPASGSLRIGREPDNSVALDDNTVSRYHAVIEPTGQGFRVRDFGSSNGTFVNSRRVGDSGVLIANGDSVRFGAVYFHFARDHAGEQDTRSYFSPLSVFCTKCGRSLLPEAVECPNCDAARLPSRRPDEVIRAGGWPSREANAASGYYPSDGKVIGSFLFALPLCIAYLVARRNRQSRNVQRVSVGIGWALTGLAYLSMAASFWPSVVGGDMYHYNKGVHYLEQKQMGLAEQEFKLTLQDNPDFAEAHVDLANVYDQTGWYEGAEQEAKNGVDILERTHETAVEGSTCNKRCR